MIDVTTGEPQVIETRHKMHKNFDIDVTIGSETHNLEVDVWHYEDTDGYDAEISHIKFSGFNYNVCGPESDVGEELHNNLDAWFGNNFDELTEEDTKEDFDEIFSTLWEYIEEKGLY